MGYWSDRRISVLRGAVFFLTCLVAAPWPFLIAALGVELSGHGPWRFWSDLRTFEGALLFVIFGTCLVAGLGFLLYERGGTRRRIQALQAADRDFSLAAAARYVFWRDLTVTSGLFLALGIAGVALSVVGVRTVTAFSEDDLLQRGTVVDAEVVRTWSEDRRDEGATWTEYFVEYRFLPEVGLEQSPDIVRRGEAELTEVDWQRARQDGHLVVLFDPVDPDRHIPLAAMEGFSVPFFLGVGLMAAFGLYPIWLFFRAAMGTRRSRPGA